MRLLAETDLLTGVALLGKVPLLGLLIADLLLIVHLLLVHLWLLPLVAVAAVGRHCPKGLLIVVAPLLLPLIAVAAAGHGPVGLLLLLVVAVLRLRVGRGRRETPRRRGGRGLLPTLRQHRRLLLLSRRGRRMPPRRLGGRFQRPIRPPARPGSRCAAIPLGEVRVPATAEVRDAIAATVEPRAADATVLV